MALMCDNAYRRIKDDSCSAHIKVNVDKAGNLMRVSQTHLDSGSFTPTTVLAGEFKIFAQTGPAQIYSATEKGREENERRLGLWAEFRTAVDRFCGEDAEHE